MPSIVKKILQVEKNLSNVPYICFRILYNMDNISKVLFVKTEFRGYTIKKKLCNQLPSLSEILWCVGWKYFVILGTTSFKGHYKNSICHCRSLYFALICFPFMYNNTQFPVCVEILVWMVSNKIVSPKKVAQLQLLQTECKKLQLSKRFLVYYHLMSCKIRWCLCRKVFFYEHYTVHCISIK